MTKRKRLLVNILMGIALALFTVAGVLVYFNYYPKVTIYFMDEFNLISSVELRKGNVLPNLPKPDKTGSTFEGWYTDEELTDIYYNRDVVNEDLELFAKFEKIEYTLKFRMPNDNEDLYSPIHLYYNDFVSIPTGEEVIEYKDGAITLATYKPGYDFVGWTLNADGTGDVYTSVTNFNMVPYNATLYPKWTPKTFSYTFRNKLYANPENTGSATIIDYGVYDFTYNARIPMPENPEILHYTFVGWYFDQDLQYAIDFAHTKVGTTGELILNDTVMNTSGVIYGKFAMNIYHINFDVNTPSANSTVLYDEEYLASIDTYYGGLVTTIPTGAELRCVLNADQTHEVYKFVGWNTRADGQGYEVSGAFLFPEDEDMTLYAMWQKYWYITFFYKSERLDYYTTKAVIGDTIQLPIALKKTNLVDDITEPGKHFNGWSVISGDSDVTGSMYTYTLTKEANISFNAEMAYNIYYVNLIVDESEKNPDVAYPDFNNLKKEYTKSFTQNSEEDINNLPNYNNAALREGYKMQGWVVIGKNSMPNKTLKINTSGIPDSFTLNETNIKYAELRDGKWVIDMRPNFVEEVYVYYNLNGAVGPELEPGYMLKDQGYVHLSKLDGITREYYTFLGWDPNANASVPTYKADTNQQFASTITLYAVWSPIKYTFNVINKGANGNGNNTCKTVTFDIENPLQLRVDVEQLNITIPNGYHLAGLTKTSVNVNTAPVDYETSDIPYTITVEEVPSGKTTFTLYTVIKINTYTIVWMVEGEEMQSASDVAHNTRLVHPADPELTGATFTHWIDEDGRVIPNSYVVSSDMVLTAVFTKNTYTITFIYCTPSGVGTNVTKEFEYNYGATFLSEHMQEINALIVAYEGYNFAGWYVAKNPDSSLEPLQVGSEITGRATYYTVYRAKPLTIIYNANGGVGDDYTVEAHYGDRITLANATDVSFSKDGMSLFGWIDGNGSSVGQIEESVTLNYYDTLILRAVWKNNYTLSFTTPAGASATGLPSQATYMADTVVNIPNNIVIHMEGLEFSGIWEDEDHNRYRNGGTITITKNTVLSPVFGTVQLTARFVLLHNGNTRTFAEVSYNYGDSVELIELTAQQKAQLPSGYVDGGWSDQPNSSTPISSFVIRENATLYLILVRTYSLSYDLNAPDASGAISAVRFIPGQAFELSSTTPIRPGYTFVGWDTVRTGELVDGHARYVAGQSVTFTDELNVVLYAQYDKADIVITYYSDKSGSPTTSEQGVKIGQTFTLPDADTVSFSNPGYRLVGWEYANGSAVGDVGDEYTVNFNIAQNWFAVWAQEYSVNFVYGVQTEPFDNVVLGELITLIDNPFDVTGKYFVNWSLGGNTYDEQEQVTITNAMIVSNTITFTAVFNDYYYDVTFVEKNPDRDVTNPAVSVIYGGTTIAPSANDTTNYRFVGWGTQEGTGVTLNAGSATEQIYVNTTYYAQYVRTYTLTLTDNVHTVSNKYDNGTLIGDGGVALTRPAEFEVSGKAIVGYYDGTTYYEIDNTYPYSFACGYSKAFALNSDVTLTAVYKDYHTVTLIDNYTGPDGSRVPGGSKTLTTTYLQFDIVDLSSYMGDDTFIYDVNHSITGYSQTSGSNVAVSVNYTMPDNNTSLYAIWGAATVDITFKPNNGSSDIIVKAQVDDTVASQTVTYTDYEFAGWYLYGTNTQYDFSSTITGALTLEAHWNKLYHVYFDLGLNTGESYTGNLPITATAYKSGGYIDLLTTIDRAGYTFVSWDYYYGSTIKATSLDGSVSNVKQFGPDITTQLFVDDTDSEHSVTFKANWTAKSFELSIMGIDNARIEKTIGTASWIYTGTSVVDTVLVYCGTNVRVDSDNRLIVNDINGRTVYYSIQSLTSMVPGGWKVNDGDNISSFAMPASNTAVKPVLAKGTMTIEYTLDTLNSGMFKVGDRMYNTYTARIDTEATSPAVQFIPSTGYEFVSWYYTTSTSTSETFSTTTIIISGEVSNCTVIVEAKLIDVDVTFTLLAPAEFTITTERFNLGVDTTIMQETNLASGYIKTVPYGSTIYFTANSSNKLMPVHFFIGDDEISYLDTNSVSVRSTTAISVRIVYDVKKALITYYDLEVSSSPHGTQTNVSYGAQVTEIKYTAENMQDIISESSGYNGRRFAGWYQDTSYTIPFTEETVVYNDMSVYAKREDLHRISFVTPTNIIVSGSVPGTQYALSNGTFDFSNVGNLAREGHTLTGWTVTYGANSVSVSLTESRRLTQVFGSLSSPTAFTAQAEWTVETYRVHFTTNTTPTGDNRAYVMDRTNTPSQDIEKDITYGDTITLTDVSSDNISKMQMSFYHAEASTSYMTIVGWAYDVTWTYRDLYSYTGQGLTLNNFTTGTAREVTSSFVVQDYSDIDVFICFNYKGNHLLQTITVESDYALGNLPVQVQLVIVNNDGIDEEKTSYVEFPDGTVLTSNYTSDFNNGATFTIAVPRYNTRSYVELVVTPKTGFYVNYNGHRQETAYTIRYSNVGTHGTHTIEAHVKVSQITIKADNTSWPGTQVWGSVGYSYTAYNRVGNYITADTSTNYASNGNLQYVLNIPYFTSVQITATATDGRTFTNWNGSSTTNPLTFNVSGDAVYSATFTPINYTYTFKINGVEWTHVSNLHTGDDITSELTSITQPTQADVDGGVYAQTTKWFDGWVMSELYTDDKIFCGVGDKTINANLVDACTFTVNVAVDGSTGASTASVGSFTYTAGSNVYVRSTSTNGSAMYATNLKIRKGTSLPAISVVRNNIGYKYDGATSTAHTYGDNITTIEYGTVNANDDMRLNFITKHFTIQYLLSDGTVWSGHSTDAIYTDGLLKGVGDTHPNHTDTSPNYYYQFTGWHVVVGGTNTNVNSSSVIVDVFGDLANGSTINVIPDYNRIQKYGVTIMDGSTTLLPTTYLFEGDTVTFSTAGSNENAVVVTINSVPTTITFGTTKQYVYLSTNSSDSGQATAGTAGIYWAKYLWNAASGGYPAYRSTVSNLYPSFTIADSNVTLYVTYVNKYTVTCNIDNSEEQIVKSDLVEGTKLSLSGIASQVYNILKPHYEVMLFSKSDAWDLYSAGTREADATAYLVGKDASLYVNPDATVLVNSSFAFTTVRRVLSKTLYVYTSVENYNNHYSTMSNLVFGGEYINNHQEEGSYVLPFTHTTGVQQWTQRITMTGDWAAFSAYQFVGYDVYQGSTYLGFYTPSSPGSGNTIDSIKMSSDEHMHFICLFKRENFNLTVKGDLVSYKTTSYTIAHYIYQQETSAVFAQEQLTTKHLYIRQSGTKYYISTDGTNYTAQSGTTYTFGVAYLTEIALKISEALNASFSSYSFGEENPTTHVVEYNNFNTRPSGTNTTFSITEASVLTLNLNVVNVTASFGENRDGTYGSDQNNTLITFGRVFKIVPYGTSITYSTNNGDIIFGIYDWKTDSFTTNETIVWSLGDTTHYRVTSISCAVSSGGVLLSNQSLTVNYARIYKISFVQNPPLSGYTASNMPTSLDTTATAVLKGQSFTVCGTNPPSITGYTFKGWQVKSSNGTVRFSVGVHETTYTLGTHYSQDETLYFYAQWDANPVTITYSIKILDPAGTDVTDQLIGNGKVNDIKWSGTSYTACYDDLFTFSGAANAVSSTVKKNTSRTVVTPCSHSFSPVLQYNNAASLSPKYEYVTYTTTGISSGRLQAGSGGASVTVTVRIKSYTITVYNGTSGTFNQVTVPYNTTITFPSRTTPTSYVRSINGTTYNNANWNKVNMSSSTRSYTDITGYTLSNFSNTDFTNGETIYLGVYNASSGGSAVNAITVSSDVTYYAQWESAWNARFNPTGTSWSGGYVMTDSCSYTADGVISSDKLYTATYLVPNSISSFNTTITFPTTHPWAYMDYQSQYYYIPSLGNSTIGYTTLTSIDSNGVLSDSGNTSFTFTLVNATDRNYIIMNTGSAVLTTIVWFKPGVSITLNSNDNGNVSSTYTSVGISKANINANFSGIAKNENILSRLGSPSGTTYSDWYTNSSYDGYYYTYGVSTDANTITTYTGLTNGKVLASGSLFDAFTKGNSSNLYAVWKTRDNSEQYFEVSNNYISRNSYAGTGTLTMPQYKTFANGNKKATYYAGTASQESNCSTLVISPVCTSFAGTSRVGMLSTNISNLIVPAKGYLKCGAGSAYGSGASQESNGYYHGSSYATANLLFSNDYSTLIFIAKNVRTIRYTETTAISVTNSSGSTTTTGGKAALISNFTTIGNYAGAYASNLTTVIFDKFVSRSGNSGYWGSNYTTTFGASSLTTIGQYAFSANTSLQYFYCRTITSIGEGAFQSCTALKMVTGLSSILESTSSGATYYCTNMNVSTLGGNYVFHNCPALTHVGGSSAGIYMANWGISSIPNYTFNGCTSITSVTFPSRYVNIGDRAFYNCNAMSVSQWPSSMDVGTYSFYNCDGITSISASMGDVASSSFNACDNIGGSLYFDAGTVGSGAFSGKNITNIYIYESSTFENGAFSETKYLTSVFVYEWAQFGSNCFNVQEWSGTSADDRVTIYFMVTPYNREVMVNIYDYNGIKKVILSSSDFTGRDLNADFDVALYTNSSTYRSWFRDNFDDDWLVIDDINVWTSNSGTSPYSYGVGWYGYGQPSCFTVDTWIDVWDEKRKKRIRKLAKDIKYTDKLIVWNFRTGKFDVASPLYIQKAMEAKEFTRIFFSDGTCFDIINNHSMYNADSRSFRPLLSDKLMPIGTHVFKDDGTLVTITDKQVIKQKVEYTNIITYDHMNVFANGLLTSTPLNNMYFIPEGTMKWEITDKRCVDTTLLEGVPQEWIDGLHLDKIPDNVLRNVIAHTPGAHNMLDWLAINKFSIMKDKDE